VASTSTLRKPGGVSTKLVAPVGTMSQACFALNIMNWARRFTRYVSVAPPPSFLPPQSSLPQPLLLRGSLDHPSFAHDIVHHTLHQKATEDFLKKLPEEEERARRTRSWPRAGARGVGTSQRVLSEALSVGRAVVRALVGRGKDIPYSTCHPLPPSFRSYIGCVNEILMHESSPPNPTWPVLWPYDNLTHGTPSFHTHTHSHSAPLSMPKLTCLLVGLLGELGGGGMGLLGLLGELRGGGMGLVGKLRRGRRCMS